MKNKIIQNKNNIFNIKRFENSKGLPLPCYATPLSAGIDLRAAIPKNNPVILKPSARTLVPSGFGISLPEGFEAQIRPRSGLAWKYGITVLNTPGTIDADYIGEIQIILVNLGENDFKIERGMRIAQCVISTYTPVIWRLCDSLESTSRGDGCFGSTGML